MKYLSATKAFVGRGYSYTKVVKKPVKKIKCIEQ